MRHSKWLREIVSAGKSFHCSRQRRVLHNGINLASLLLVCALYASVLGVGARASLWWYLPVATFLFGCLNFALFILVIHECSHTMFVVTRNAAATHRLNHRIGWFFGVLLLTDYANHWERNHLPHHLYPSDPVRDLQTPYPLDGWPLLRRALWLLVPGGALVINPSRGRGYPLGVARLTATIGFWIVLCSGCAVWLHWQTAVALILAFNVTALLNLLKIAQEHASGLAQQADPLLRQRTYFYPLRYLTSPFNINYHFEHHLSFGVPWYLLPAYHRRAMALMPESLRPYYVTRGVGEYFQQLAGLRTSPPV